jgi:DNA-binding NtrC family response regulator
VKSPVLFIGYDASMRDEIREFLKDHHGEAFFSDSVEETLKIMHSKNFKTVVLNLQRLEDAAILRYINLHYQKTHVVVMPGRQLQDVIPALADGHFDLLKEPFRLEELNRFL